MAESLFHATRRGGRRSRRRLLVSASLGGATIAVLSAAIAWACVPATSMGFDRSPYDYRAGETVGVVAQGFYPSRPYKLTMTSPSGATTAVGKGANGDPVLAGPAGDISDSFALPADAAPGSYIVRVENTNEAGTATRVARETLTVVTDGPTPPPGSAPPLPAPGTRGAAKLAPAVGTSFLTGTSANDTITGTPFADVISCGAGNDTVRGMGGNDVIKCGAGNDRISGGAGKDIVSAGSGNDKASGGAGNDTLRGNAGSDTLRGDAGTDRLLGGIGSDRLYRDSKDKLSGGAGRDSTVAVK